MILPTSKSSLSVILLLFVVASGCGTSELSSQRQTLQQNPQSPQILMLWLGEYAGTMTYSYSGVSDKRGGEGFPAHLIFEEYGGQILFELTAFHLPATWQFLLPYTLFSSSYVEFTRNALFEETEYQFAVSAVRADSTLSGTMKMYIRNPDGGLSPKGGYVLNFIKN